MQENKITYAFEFHLFGRCIFSFQFIRTSCVEPVGALADIISRVSEKLGVSTDAPAK